MRREPADPADLPEIAAAVPEIARVAGALPADAEVHLVGGAVRDLLLGRRPGELDLVCVGDAPALARAVASRLGGRATVHGRFGTATVEAGDLRFDVVTARAESYPRPGALPDVRPGTLAEDLARRDFTINAMALALSGGEPGAFHAVDHAYEDLRAGVLRVLHERSFLDDATRLLRLVRYRARLGLSVERRTAELARSAARDGALDTLSGVRLRDALLLALAEERADRVIEAAHELGIAAALHPGLDAEAVGELAAARALLPADGRADLLTLAVWARAIAPSELRRLLDRLRLEGDAAAVVLDAVEAAPGVARELLAAERPSQVAAAAAGHPVETLARAGALGAREPVGRYLDALRGVELQIGGEDLLAAGIPQGPAIGRALRAALEGTLDGELVGRDAQLRRALEVAREQPSGSG